MSLPSFLTCFPLASRPPVSSRWGFPSPRITRPCSLLHHQLALQRVEPRVSRWSPLPACVRVSVCLLPQPLRGPWPPHLLLPAPFPLTSRIPASATGLRFLEPRLKTPSLLDCCTPSSGTTSTPPLPPACLVSPPFPLRCRWKTHSAGSAQISPFPGQRGQTPQLGSYSPGSILSSPQLCGPHQAPAPELPSCRGGPRSPRSPPPFL